jgi:hypothetical protein
MVRKFLRKIPYSFLVPLALLLGFAPFAPEPHLLGKFRLLFAGQLVRPLDIFDLLMHLAPVVLLFLKLIFSGTHESESSTM